MKTVRLLLLTLFALSRASAAAQTFEAEFAPLLEASCIECHDADTKSRLNFDALGHDLSDPATFRQWVKVFDRVHKGDMPPAKKPRPDPAVLAAAMDGLESDLLQANHAMQQSQGRVPFRRLTRLEYAQTLRDLLGIEEDVAGSLPAESDSGGFDTVGAAQRTSALHIQSYLQAADQALDAAIRLRQRPPASRTVVDYLHSPSIDGLIQKTLVQGGSNLKKLPDAVVMFLDLDYVMRSDHSGLKIQSPGRYRVTIEARTHQADRPMTLKLIQGNPLRDGAELIGAFELTPGTPTTVEVTTFMRPRDYLYPTVHLTNLNTWNGLTAVGGAKNYLGEGIAIQSMQVEGPLAETQPPPLVRALLNALPAADSREPMQQVTDVLGKIAPRVFRRPVRDGEVESFASLARPAIEEGRGLTDALRISLRSMLSSPQFLFFDASPGRLDDFALASRLSYFLWKSMPDETLFQLAREGRLSDPAILRQQVERMLDDEKSGRFVRDFLGQWLRLYDLNATTPDRKLYPEFDGLLGQSIQQETERFFAHLIKDNLSTTNFIDSDFTFVNRRLAEHYQLPPVEGADLRKVSLPPESPRGGILGQASVLKLTANGTFTSPVKRGVFVLTHLLGEAPEPPPPNVGSIEPDTRGTTTIRQTLDQHRHLESCAQCHRSIDPPGFALECFDPIGGFRTNYRAATGQPGRPYKQGPLVDASGVTAQGETFAHVWDYKQRLLTRKDQVAHHFISQLIVYATGAEIQFADRAEVERIADQLRAAEFPVRSIIHAIVQSPLFTQP